MQLISPATGSEMEDQMRHSNDGLDFSLFVMITLLVGAIVGLMAALL
jgi:hypothetical protein